MFNIWDGKAIKIWENENIAIVWRAKIFDNRKGQSCAEVSSEGINLEN